MAAKVVFGEAFEGHTVVLMARVVGADGSPLVAADLTSIKYEVWSIPIPTEYDLRDARSKYVTVSVPEKVTSETTLTVADVIFDTLQTDPRWTKDSTGYNFAVEMPDDAFDVIPLDQYPKAQWHEVAVRFVPTDGEPFAAAFKVAVKSLLFGKGT